MNVWSSVAIKAAYLELLPAFTRSSKVKVDTQWVGMADIRKRILAGEVTDVVIGSAALIEDLINGGNLDSRTRVDFAKSEVGAAVRSGARKPDIGNVEALKNALRAAKSVVISSGPSGVYLVELFQRLGLAEELKPKARQARPGVLVGELVASGEFELCFQQVSELRQVRGIDFVGRLPREIQLSTVFSGAVHSKSAQAKPGSELLHHLASKESVRVLRRHGLEPA
ncbi:MAG TPA: substrate-binding domain-containing protein [Burkholderiales bacterium]|jgi:molybdate transport system substrate-binding protein